MVHEPPLGSAPGHGRGSSSALMPPISVMPCNVREHEISALITKTSACLEEGNCIPSPLRPRDVTKWRSVRTHSMVLPYSVADTLLHDIPLVCVAALYHVCAVVECVVFRSGTQQDEFVLQGVESMNSTHGGS